MKTIYTTLFLLKSYILSIGLLLLTIQMKASPDCPILDKDFHGLTNGTTSDSNATGWYLDASNVNNALFFAVKSNRIHAEHLGGEGIWYSKVFSAEGYTDFQVSTKIHSEGDMNSSEYVKVYYKIDGGPEVLFAQRTGNFGTIDFISPFLNGSTVQIIVRLYNYDNGGSQTSKYHIEKYAVFKEDGPCNSSISVLATATNEGVLTCTNPSLTLSANSNASNLSYNWTGPNSFSSSIQNPIISIPGTYTVEVTNSNGSASASILITENKGPSELVWLEKFNLNNGTTSDSGTTAWTTENTSSGGFHVNDNRFKVNNTGNNKKGIWTSEEIDISDKSNVKISLNLYSIGDMETSGDGLDFLDVYYRLNGGQEISFSINSGSINGNSTSGKEVSIGSLDGTTLQIIVKSRTTHSSEFYYFDNVKVVGISQNTIDASASVDGQLSCTNNSVTLTGESSSSDVTYKWTGPNDFERTGKNITVDIPGNYELKVSPNSGCSNPATATVTVIGNTILPNISASVDGTLGCSSDSVILRGNSTTPNVTYNWTGPNNFSSTLQNPTVNETGNYTLEVVNSDNGCTSSLSVNVASSDGIETTLWLEKFNLSTGTTSDSGATAWTTQNPSSGGFHVKDNRFKVNNTGNDKKGIWTSESIDISGKNNVTISLDMYSTGGMESSGTDLDFLDVYYSLNGGQNISFSINSGSINNNSSSGITASIGSLNGSTLQIIVKSRTTASDEFYYFDNVKVTEKSQGTIDATASVEGILTCITNTVTITGGSSANDVNYTWTGPNNFSASTKNINVTEPGEYTLEVTNTIGCTGSTAVTVIRDIETPNISASVDGTLSCSSGSVTLQGNSTTPNVSYNWTGPNNFSSTLQNPTVSETGNYTLEVVNSDNGCTSSLSVNVASSDGIETTLWLEKFNLSTGTTSDSGATAWTTQNPSSGGFHVKDNRFKVNNTGNDKKGIWTSESIDISGKNNVTISLDMYSTGGMESSGTDLDFLDVYYSLNGGQNISFSINSGSINNNSSSGITASIGSLNGSTLQIIVKSRTTASDEFYYFDNVKVTEKSQGTIDATASVEGILTCITNTVTIIGGSSANDVNYTWTGPNNFSASTKNINVTEPGEYTLEVINTIGCTGSTTVTVSQNIAKPNVSASVEGTLSCSSDSVILKGNSTTPNVTYSWTGPNNFSSILQNPTANEAGSYSLKVTDPNNGCTSSFTVNVTSSNGTETTIWLEKFNLSNGTTSDSGTTAWTTQNPSSGNFQVKSNQFIVENTGNDKKGIWTSESIDISEKNDVNISVHLCSVGDMENSGSNLDFIDLYYRLDDGQKIRFSKNSGSINGNSTSGIEASVGSLSGTNLEIIIKSRTTNPGEIYYFDNVKVTAKNQGTIDASASVEGILTCTTDVITITGGSSANDVNYTWTGPNGFTANTKDINVSEPGEYTLEVTNNNGCSGSTTVTVSQDLNKPELTATADGIITCSNTSIALTATSITPNVTFNWEGFTAGENPVNVTSEGDYVVTATNTINGCSIQQTVTVGADLDKPELTATADGIITCTNTMVTLTATSTTPNVTFNWEGFTDGENPVNVTSEGDYVVTATNTINGCSIQQTVTVGADLDKPELTATADGIITCSNTSVALTATSTTLNVIYSWEGFTAGENPVNVTSEGDYIVTATNTINGCSIQQTVTVSADLDKPELTATADGIITCSNTSVALTATSTTPNVTFNWEGFTAGENPVNVTSEGDYVVTATNTINGCSIQQTVTVGADLDKPELTATADGIITCSNTMVTLTATSTTPNVTFNWEGFTTGENPVNVTSEGDYVVTATNTMNGCSIQRTVTVSADLDKPELTATADGIITCSNTSVALTATSTTPNVTFNWEGFTAGENPVNVTSEGDYVVTATNTINGCSIQQTVTVGADLDKPELTATADGIITCSNTMVTLTATSTTPNVTFNWEGFTTGENPVNVTSEGDYVVTATNTMNGCSIQRTVTVSADLDKPELTATADGIITCSNTSVALTATSTTPNVTFNWEGFTAGENPVNVTSEGDYVVTATNTINGCSIQQTVTVSADLDKPELTATADGIITCSNTSVALTATSITPNVIFNWEGFTAGENPVNVTSEGEYMVTATNTITGCTEQEAIIVSADLNKPELTATADGIITCSNTSVALTATSITPNVTFNWEGFTTGENPVNVTSEGDYVVTATNTINGCSIQQTVTVGADLDKPELTATADGIITCSNTSVALTATSITPNVTFNWEGFTTGENPVNVTSEGDYVVTATNTINGCSIQQTVTVGADLDKPELTATADGIITCSNTSVALTATSITPNVTFNWEGFTTGENPVNVTSEGDYVVTATNTINGCSIQQTVTVGADLDKPELTATADGIITCSNTSVALTATSITPNVIFNWEGFTDGENPVNVTSEGDYVVTATNTINGCSIQQTVTVGADLNKPELTATANGIITCSNTSVALTATSITPNVTFDWEGFTAGENPVNVTSEGDYVVTATNTINGCSIQQTVTVSADLDKPELTATADGIITCSNTSVALTATSITPNVTFNWEGFTAGENPVNVTSEGDYVVTATNTINGCSIQRTVTVGADLDKPELTATADGVITCSNTSVALTATSITPNVTFNWEGFTDGENPVNVTSEGDYVVTATNTINGCSIQQTVTVGADLDKPELTATADGIITCSNTSVALIATSTTPNVTFDWEGFTAGENPVNVTSEGDYVVTATNTINGCSIQKTVTVGADLDKPELTATADRIITCTNTMVTLTATSTTPNVIYSWEGFTTGENPVNVTSEGDYVVTATNTINGCSIQQTVTVSADLDKPELTATANGIITCSNTSVALTATSITPNVIFNWEGFTDGENPVNVTSEGDYVVTATNTINGCSIQQTVTVGADLDKPELTATADGIITCSNTSVALTATSITPNVTFSWEGFTAGENPVNVTSEGDYVVTATNTINGCSIQQTVTVGADLDKPELTATADGIITCSNTSVALTATSITPNVIFNWEGFTDGENPVNVTSEGDYVVTATNTINGCSIQQTVTVSADLDKPELTATADGIITCSNTSVALTATSITPNVTFNWEGFTAGENPVNVTSEGDYVVTATNTINGCSIQQTVTVGADLNKPELTATADGIITCSNTSVALTATSTTSNVTFNWEGFTAGENPVNVTSEGEYMVTATNTITGCTEQEAIIVSADLNKPELTATANGIITCSNTSVALTATSITPNVTFNWEGFTDGENPVNVTSEGDYVVTATNTINGCSIQQTVTVSADLDKPELTATADGVITCSNTSVALTATSITPNVTFNWEGFTAGENPVNVTSEGEYMVTATNTITGCTEQKAVIVSADLDKPELTATADGIITCSNTSVALTATSITPNVTFNWEGFTAGENPVNVTSEGEYMVTATNTITGCTEQKAVIVSADLDKPELTATADGIITCSNTSVALTATSITPNVTFNWEGFTDGENPVNVTSEGDYVVTATNTINGCSIQQTVTVSADLDKPELTATADGIITCSNTSVALTATSITPNVTFDWEGFTAGENPVNVTSEGDYIVTATNTINGCSIQQTVTVSADLDKPELTATADGIITCSNTSVALTATSITPNVTFNWEGFTAGENPVNVTSEGEYMVTATNTITGCTEQEAVIVSADLTKPELTTTADGIITCSNTSVALTATSITPNVTFDWEGFTAGENPVNVTSEGDYVVTATNTINGCSIQQTVTVGADLDKPELTATADGIITCSNTSVALTATSITPNVTFNWEGFTDGENPVNVTSEGDYVVTATNTINGCSIQQTVTVSADLDKPELTATADGIITCSNTSVALTATSITPNVTFNWEGFTDGENPVNVTSEGDYVVTATNTINGCSIQQTVTVSADLDKPELTATADGIITCSNTSVALIATSTTPNVTFDWEGFTAGENPVNVTSEGDYVVTATNTINGCSIQKTVTVSADLDKPELTATADGIITCRNTSVALTATSITPNVTFNWEGFTAGENPVNVTSEGEYMVTATNTITGCTEQEAVIVSADLNKPELTATADGIITCSNTSVALTATSTTANVTFNWEGFTAGENPVNVTSEGEYMVTATNTITGCTEQETIIISADLTKPELTATADGTITCTNTSVALTATSITPNVTFNWEGFTSGENPVNVTSEGEYMVTATNTITGCTEQETIIVTALCDEKNDGLQSVSNIETRAFTKFIAKAYPNPSRDKATIAFSSAKEGNAKIEIYTITGILVNTLFDEKIEADRQYYTTFNQDGDLPSGVYFYVVRIGNNFTTNRIILAK